MVGSEEPEIFRLSVVHLNPTSAMRWPSIEKFDANPAEVQ
jgi:hypothetical protein